jgi:outer membrane protein assembly factor BamD (BamD/ComL family)
MSATRIMRNHVRALEELLARYAPGEYRRDVIEQRLAEARAALTRQEQS